MTFPSKLTEYVKTSAISAATAAAKKAVPLATAIQEIQAKNPAQVVTSNNARSLSDGTDLRVRISLAPKSPTIFYLDENNDIQRPLYSTNGFIFPIQPQMTMSFGAEYQKVSVVHSNFPYYHYTSSEMKPISLTGEFIIRTVYDAWYVQAGLHFLRSMTRMFTNRDGDLAGFPPLVGRLNGLGFNGFDNIPVVVNDITFNFPENVDYVTFPVMPNEKTTSTTEFTKLPVTFNVSINLSPVFSRAFISNKYNTTGYSESWIRLLGKPFGSAGTTKEFGGYTPITLRSASDYIPDDEVQSIGDIVDYGASSSEPALPSLPQQLGSQETPLNWDQQTMMNIPANATPNALPGPPQQFGVQPIPTWNEQEIRQQEILRNNGAA